MPPENDGNASFSADDLNLVADTDAGDGDKTAGSPDNSAGNADKTAKAGDPPIADGGADPKAVGEGEKAEPKTIAEGKETKDPDPEAKKPYWPEDWREKLAEHLSAGDKKVYDKELRRLQRINEPTGLYGMYRELDNRLNGGGLIKVPAKDAKPEEVEAYRKALGVPEKPDDYLTDLTLSNGAVIGEADKPRVDAVLGAMHKAGATPDVVKAALDWYYTEQEQAAADLDEADDTFRRESERALKDELGSAFQRTKNAIAPLFATAPGGIDFSNENALIGRILGGRTSDGRIIGNDPDVIRWLASMAQEINPAATVVEGGDQSGKALDVELAEIRALLTTDKKKYWSEPVQKRELELIGAIEKLKAKA